MDKTKEQLELENEIYKKALRRIQNINDDKYVKDHFYENGYLLYPEALGAAKGIAIAALVEGEAVRI